MSASPSPTSVVIAHGAFYKASSFDDFANELSALGMKAVVPQLPSSDPTPPEDAFAADVAVLNSALCAELSTGRNVILLAHSYGGIPGCKALRDLPTPLAPATGKVLGVVFLSAFVADEEQNLITAKKGAHASWVRCEGELAYVNDAETTLFNGVADAGHRASLAADLTAQALSSFKAAVSYAGWKHYPTFYIVCENDNAHSVEEQQHFISRLKQHCGDVGEMTLYADHCPHASMPKELAQRLTDTVKCNLERRAFASEGKGAIYGSEVV